MAGTVQPITVPMPMPVSSAACPIPISPTVRPAPVSSAAHPPPVYVVPAQAVTKPAASTEPGRPQVYHVSFTPD